MCTDSSCERIYLQLLEAGHRWLNEKIQRMRNLLAIALPDEGLYRELMLSLGYPKNRMPFLELALLTPFREIRSLKDRILIERALLYRASLSDEDKDLPEHFDRSLRISPEIWQFKGIRPSNRPDKRIRGISYLLSSVINDGLVSFFEKRIREEMSRIDVNNISQREARKIRERIMQFQGVGSQRRAEMFFNIILPFFMALRGNEKNLVLLLMNIFTTHPPLTENTLVKSFKNKLPAFLHFDEINKNTCTFFGIIYLTKSE